jgi:hypothetical protein
LVGWSVGQLVDRLPPLLHCCRASCCAAAAADAKLPLIWLPPPPSWLLPPRCSWDNYFVCVFLFWQVVQSLMCK